MLSFKQAHPLHTWPRGALSDYEESFQYKLDKTRAELGTSECFLHTKLHVLLSGTWEREKFY